VFGLRPVAGTGRITVDFTSFEASRFHGLSFHVRPDERVPDGNQEGQGHVIAIPRGVIACPVAALQAWLEGACITEGRVFRPIAKGGRIQRARLTDRSVAEASIFKMADQSLHKSPDTLRGYARDDEIFKDHAGKGLL
jgi:hypothetical protein